MVVHPPAAALEPGGEAGRQEVGGGNLVHGLENKTGSSYYGGEVWQLAPAAWAVWQAYPFVWATVIAVSQVVQAARPFLPNRKFLQRLHALQNEVERLAIQVEFDRYQVANGSLTEQEINEKVRVARLALHDVQVRCFEESTLPEKQGYMEMAREKTRSYLESNYSVRETHG